MYCINVKHREVIEEKSMLIYHYSSEFENSRLPLNISNSLTTEAVLMNNNLNNIL